MSDPTTTPPKRRTWLRRVVRFLLVAFVLFAVLLALAPIVAGPIARKLAEAGLRERLGVEAEIGDVSLRHDGTLRVGSVRVPDAEGDPMIAWRTLETDVHLGALIRGRFEVTTVLDGLEVDLVERAPGTFNVQMLPWERLLDDLGGGGGAGRGRGEGGGALPDVAASVVVSDARVSVSTAAGRTDVEDLDVRVTLRALDAPAAYTLMARTRRGGAIELSGEVTLARNGRVGPDTVAGDAALTLQAVLVEELVPALASLAPIDAASGKLDGGGALSFGPEQALRADLDLGASGLAAGGSWSGSGMSEVGDLVLRADVELDGSGSGPASLALLAPGLVELRLTGSAAALGGEAPRFAGDADMKLDLAGAVRVLGDRSPLRDGVAVEGTLRVATTHDLSLAPNALDAGGELTAEVEGLAASRDGEPIDLGELASFRLALEGAFDLAAGSADLSRLTIEGGPVRASANGLVGGLDGELAGLTLGDGAYELTADLDRLRVLLAPLADLHGEALAGRVTARGTASSEEGVLRIEGQLAATDLLLGGGGDAPVIGPLDVRADHLAELDLAPGGESRFDLTAHAAGHELVIESSARDLSDPARRTGTLSVAAVLAGSAKDGTLAGLPDVLPVRARGLSAGAEAALEGRELTAELRARGSGLALRGARGELLALETLDASGSVALDLEGDRLDLLDVLVTTDLFEARLGASLTDWLARERVGVDLEVSAQAPGLEVQASGAGELDRAIDGTLTAEVRPGELGAELRALLGEWDLRGQPLTLGATWSRRPEAVTAKGSLEGPLVRVLLPATEGAGEGETPARGVIRQTGLSLAFDVEFAPATLGLSLHEVAYASQLGTLTASGEVDLGASPAPTADLAIAATGDVARLVGGPGSLAGLDGWSGGGSLEASLAVEGHGELLQFAGTAILTDLVLAPPDGAAPPPVPRLELVTSTSLDVPGRTANLSEFSLDSDAANCRASGVLRWGEEGSAIVLDGVRGDLTYVPEQLGALLAPWLPGELSGSEERAANFSLDGALAELDLGSLLAAAEADSSVALGTWSGYGVEATGSIDAAVANGLATATGDLEANGGTLRWSATVDGRGQRAPDEPAPVSQGRLVLRQVRVLGDSASALASLHPLFASAASERKDEDISALVTLELDTTYAAPLDWSTLVEDPLSIPTQPLYAEGFARITEVQLQQGSLLGEMLELIGVESISEIRPRRVDFEIRAGRLRYTLPWKWVLADVQTDFTGSIGLDQTLDLSWNLPITKKLVAREDRLKYIAGETISIPITGTLSAPRFGYDQILPQLLDKALKKQLEQAAGGLLGGDGGDPATLLREADQLWSAGKKARARKLYQQLKDDYSWTLVYVLNKSRIKERAKP